MSSQGVELIRKDGFNFPNGLTGGFLTIPYFSEINLDPTFVETPDDKMIARLIHRGLLKRGSKGSIETDLATMYELRGLTYTFYLDNNAYFHSGKAVESYDVLYTLEKIELNKFCRFCRKHTVHKETK